jgi:hypothetical protein
MLLSHLRFLWVGYTWLVDWLLPRNNSNASSYPSTCVCYQRVCFTYTSTCMFYLSINIYVSLIHQRICFTYPSQSIHWSLSFPTSCWQPLNLSLQYHHKYKPSGATPSVAKRFVSVHQILYDYNDGHKTIRETKKMMTWKPKLSR